MRIVRATAWSVGVWCLLTGTAFAQVRLTIADGRVTLVAKDVTVRQILAEWARVGGTKIVNGDRVTGEPVTLELHDVPEGQALDIILRSVSGYIAAPRETALAALAAGSVFDRIVVMPTSTPPAAPRAASSPTPVFPQPGFPQPGFPQRGPQARMPMGAPGDEEEQTEERMRAPVFNGFPPGSQMVNPGVVPAPGPLALPQAGGSEGQATMPTGAAQPGMIVQPPQPTQPRRPGGPGGDI